MNVIREDVNATTAYLNVQITPEDYNPKVKAALAKYQKQARIPGFRPGKVPMGLIQKQYGKSLLAEELNTMVNEALTSYITENNLEILGNPIPKEGEDMKGDFNNPADFEFAFEIGLTPTFDIDFGKQKFDFVTIKIDATLVDKQLDDLRRRYGKLVASEEVGDSDLILAQFVELNDDESIKEGGILHSSTISMEFVEDKATKKALSGKKVGDKVVVDPNLVSRGGKDTAAMLGTSEDKLAEISSKFQLTINEIRKMELAELNQELFDKLFGEGVVTTEEELKARISEDLAKMFENDSDRLLTNHVYEYLINNVNMELPMDFLKRWIQLSNEKPITLEEIEAQIENYEKGMKWQLIQGKLFKDNNLQVQYPEILEYTKGLIVSQYAQYGIPTPEDAELTKTAAQVMADKNESNRIYEMLADRKLTSYFKETVSLKKKEVSYDDFVELANK
jgi:trigger factor